MPHWFIRLAAMAGILALGCSPLGGPLEPAGSSATLLIPCHADLVGGSMGCDAAAQNSASDGLSLNVIVGNQNLYVHLGSSAVSYTAGDFRADVTVQNLLVQPMGTPDGATADPAGIRVFFTRPPVVTAGTGTVSISGADGMDTFTAAAQPYYRYDGILAPRGGAGSVSAPRTWHFSTTGSVTRFDFYVMVSAKLPDDQGVFRWLDVSDPSMTADLGEVSQANGLVWAVGTSATIRHYNGSSWSTEASPVPGVTLRGVLMIPGATVTGLAVGDNSTILSYDGTWHTVTTTPAGGTTLTTLCRVGANDFYVVGAGGYISHSTNPTNAASWQQQTPSVVTDFFTCGGAEPGHVFVSGVGGVILHSTGNGTWTQETSGTPNALRAIAIVNDGAGHLATIWLTGGSLGAPGTMLRSSGNGVWTPVAFTGDPVIRGLQVRDPSGGSDIFGVGAGGTITHYNGSTWSAQAGGTTAQLNHVTFRDLAGGGREWWAVGNGGIVLRGVR